MLLLPLLLPPNCCCPCCCCCECGCPNGAAAQIAAAGAAAGVLPLLLPFPMLHADAVAAAVATHISCVCCPCCCPYCNFLCGCCCCCCCYSASADLPIITIPVMKSGRDRRRAIIDESRHLAWGGVSSSVAGPSDIPDVVYHNYLWFSERADSSALKRFISDRRIPRSGPRWSSAPCYATVLPSPAMPLRWWLLNGVRMSSILNIWFGWYRTSQQNRVSDLRIGIFQARVGEPLSRTLVNRILKRVPSPGSSPDYGMFPYLISDNTRRIVSLLARSLERPAITAD